MRRSIVVIDSFSHCFNAVMIIHVNIYLVIVEVASPCSLDNRYGNMMMMMISYDDGDRGNAEIIYRGSIAGAVGCC